MRKTVAACMQMSKKRHLKLLREELDVKDLNPRVVLLGKLTFFWHFFPMLLTLHTHGFVTFLHAFLNS